MDLTAISLSAGLLDVLNCIFSPIFFQMLRLPFLCDLIVFSVLAVAVWWTRKLGSVTLIGLIATVINFVFNPGAIQFLGFTAASFVFDTATWVMRYNSIFRKTVNIAFCMIALSFLSAAVAGFIIGSFFMVAPALAKWGVCTRMVRFACDWRSSRRRSGLILVTGLISRGIQTQVKQISQLGKQANDL